MDLHEAITDLLQENFKIQTVNTKTINTMNRSVTKDKVAQMVYKVLKSKLHPDQFEEYKNIEPDDQVGLLWECFHVACSNQKEMRDAEKVAKRAQDKLEQHGIDYSSLVFLVDMDKKDEDEDILYDTDNKKVLTTKWTKLRKLIGDKAFNAIESQGIEGIYDPMLPSQKIIAVDGSDYDILNKYIEPNWLGKFLAEHGLDSLETLKQSNLKFERCSLPELMGEFFEWLFPEKKSRLYVYDWIYDCLTSPQGSEYILMLNGPTGTGKTTFALSFLSALLHEDNHFSGQKSFFTSDFNSGLINNRIVFLDEVKVDDKKYNTLKLYANKTLNIEKKGVDATGATKLYHSFVCCNNKISNYYVDPDDRRNSIIETTKMKMKGNWSDKKMTLLNTSFLDDDFMYQVGVYFLSRSWQDDDTREKPFAITQYKTELFWKFVERSLNVWKRRAIYYVMSESKAGREELPIKYIAKRLARDERMKKASLPDNEEEIVEFFEGYMHRGEYYLGEVKEEVAEDGYPEYVLKINSKLIAKPKDLGEDGDDLL